MEDIEQLISKIKAVQLPQEVEEPLLDMISTHHNAPEFIGLLDALIQWGVIAHKNEIKAEAYDKLKKDFSDYEHDLHKLIEQHSS